MDHLKAPTVVLVKWVIIACDSCQSNLHMMLTYCLGFYQLFGGGNWTPSLIYFTLISHVNKQGSLIWNKVLGSIWKQVVRDVEYVEPTNCKGILSKSVWWSLAFSSLIQTF